MDYPRCTNCRNPIKAHQSRVTNPADGLLYHDDCWSTAFSVLQGDYLRRIESDGVDAILAPYVCRAPEAWLPEQREGYPPEPGLEDPVEAVLEVGAASG